MINNFRKYFPIYKKYPKLTYLDSSATSLKPQCVIDAITKYYIEISANLHRGDYHTSNLVDAEYLKLKNNLVKLLNAKSIEEFIITSGTTLGLNQIFYGIENLVNPKEEIITDIYEHSSMILPIFRIAKNQNLKINYINKKPGKITWEDIKPHITKKTKIVAINHVSNLTGFINDVEKIGKELKLHYPNIIFIVDLAQSIPHIKVDVQKIQCDFAVFSAHKMFGPTGIGVIYIDEKWKNKLEPMIIGGGMFTKLNMDSKTFIPNYSVYKFEAGTLNLAGIFGFNAAIEFMFKIGYEQIISYEKNIHKYALEQLQKIPNIQILNPQAEISIISFNHPKLFCQDVSTQLSLNDICVRAGQHCVKLSYIGTKTMNSVRASFSIYNTKEDVDNLVQSMQNLGDGLDAFF